MPQPAHLNRNQEEGMTAIGVWRGVGHSRGVEKLTFLMLLVGLAIVSVIVGNRYGSFWGGVVGIFLAPLIVASFMRHLLRLPGRRR